MHNAVTDLVKHGTMICRGTYLMHNESQTCCDTNMTGVRVVIVCDLHFLTLIYLGLCLSIASLLSCRYKVIHRNSYPDFPLIKRLKGPVAAGRI